MKPIEQRTRRRGTDYGGHAAIAAESMAARMLNALDRGRPRPIPCQFVAPITGG